MSADCIHPGSHARGIQCPDCGRFCSHGWDTGWFHTDNGAQQMWGGVCKVHGEFMESAA